MRTLEEAVMEVREAALQLKIRTKEHALAMTVGNMAPLLVKERGIPGLKIMCEQILDNTDDVTIDQQRLRSATRRLASFIKIA